MRLLECIPIELSSVISQIDGITELRIRDYGVARVCVGGTWFWVGKTKLESSIVFAQKLGVVCDGIVRACCDGSVFAFEKMLVNGYFTMDDGVRIGVCGDIGNENPVSFRHFTSLCIRFPHDIRCVPSQVIEQCADKNLLVVAAPGCGKTTFLRDFAQRLSTRENVVVVDERGELFPVCTEEHNLDVFRYVRREYACEAAIRSLSPDRIVCDELTQTDVSWVKRALGCGVRLACSAHGICLEDVRSLLGSVLDGFQTVVLLDKMHRAKIYSEKMRSTMAENKEI